MADLKTRHFGVCVSDQFREAIERAAAKRFTSASEYARQSILERLRADGIDPTAGPSRPPETVATA